VHELCLLKKQDELHPSQEHRTQTNLKDFIISDQLEKLKLHEFEMKYNGN
jgi:hypothetical protein